MTEPVNITLLLDRFLSASTAADVQNALEHVLSALQDPSATEALLAEPDVLKGIIKLLATQSYKNVGVEDGDTLCARILWQILQTSSDTAKTLLQRPELALIEVLMDVAATNDDDDSIERSSYTRVLCLQSLEKLCHKAPQLAQQQLLQAPNGLHRLGELLHCADLAVRNQALLVAHFCAAWPAVSQVWIFLNIVPTLLQVALQEGGLQNGTVVVQDCLRLLGNLLRHDSSMAELVFQEQSLAPQLSVLLDLRLGTEFVHPVPKKKKIEPLLSRKKPVDDLDDLLMERSSNPESSSDEEIVLPRLTRDEEKVIHAVLDILELVLENNKVRQAICTQDLASMVWELGLVNFPPPGVAAPCAYPSASLQQRALQITARYLNDPILLQNHNALHRLLHLVCMGGIPKDREAKLGVSQSALHLLRQTVSPEQAQEMLLNTLAPPLTEDETPDLTPVQRLLITVENNLGAPPDTGRTVLLVGSTCALSLFLVDTASREMMVRLMDSGLLPSILELLPKESDALVTLVLLRFLCQWMDGSPLVVQSILGAPQSATTWAALLESKDTTIAAYASLLLGMALNQMTDQQDVTKYGGWTREGILSIFKHSLNLFLSRLDELGSNPTMWSFCPLERKVWMEEFQANVWTVRKRLVAEMTVHSEPSDEISSMQALIEKQSSELEELRQELKSSKQSLVQQEKELSHWKVRAESTPTQLDELLNQSTSRNIELEQKVEELEQFLHQVKAEHAAEISRNTELVESLQAEVNSSLQNETQTREDLETMQGEMTALSQAYAILEAEYRRQSELLSTSTTGVEGSEQSAHRHPGEESQKDLSRGNSTEVAILRAENTRLKNDMKVAEDWMAMAHQKLSEILTENNALKGEVSSLRGQVQPLGDQNAALQQELNLLRESCASSSNEDLRVIISQTLQQMELEKKLREEAESEVIQIREVLQKAEKDKSDLEQRVSDMNQVFTPENAVTLSDSQCKTLSGESATVDLHEEVEAVRKELASVLKREEEAINNRDARINELESRLAESNYPSEELLRRDKEIEELKQLTHVAQEWMDNAIEQYRALQQEKEALLSEKANLTSQLSELDNQIKTLTLSNSMTTAQPDLQAVTFALQEKESLLSESRASLSEMQASLIEKESCLDSLRLELQSANDEIQRKCSELESLRQNSSDAANESQHLRDQAEALTSREQELCKEIDGLRNGQSSKQDLIEGLRIENNSSQANLLLQIEEYKTMVRNLEAQLSEQESDSSEMVKEWETTYNDLEKRHMEVLDEKQKLEVLCNAKDARIYELQDDNQSKDDKLNELATQLEKKTHIISSTNNVDAGGDENREDKDATIKTLSDEVETLKQQLQAMDAESVDAISRWQASYTDLEARYLELCNSKETPAVDGKDAVQLGIDEGPVDRVSELAAQVTSLQQQLADAESESAAVVARWQEAYAELEEKVRVASTDESGLGADVQASNDGLADPVSELSALVTSLQEQLREADVEHTAVLEKWQQGYAELEEKVRIMSSAKNVDAGGDENREDKDAAIKTLSDEVETLKQQLQAMDAESVDAISRWQASYTDLEARYLELCNSKETPAVDGKDAVQLGIDEGPVDRVSELAAQVTSLQQQLADAESESAAVVARWQEAYAELEEKVRVASTDESGLGADVQASNDGLADPVSELSALVTSLQEQLREADVEHTAVLEKWQQGYAELEEKVRIMSSAKNVDAGGDENREDKDAAIKTLSDEVETLKQQLQAMDAESVDAISRWQASYTDLEARYLELCNSKETPAVDGKDAVQLGIDEGPVDRVSELAAQVTSLQQQLTDAESESAAVVARWQEAYAELEEKVRVLSSDNNLERERYDKVSNEIALLRSHLLEQETEAQNAIRQWELSYAELEERLLKVTKEIDCALSSGSPGIVNHSFLESAAVTKSMKDNVADTQGTMGDNNVLDALREREERITELTNEVSLLQRELFESEEEAANAISIWEQSYANLEAELQLAKKNNSERNDSEDVDDRDSLLTKMTIHIATLNEQLLFYRTQTPPLAAIDKNDRVNSEVVDSPANIKDASVTQLEDLHEKDADEAFAEQRSDEGPEETILSSLHAEVNRLQCDIKVMQEEKQTSVAELQERLALATSEMVETKQQLGLLKTELEQNKLQANEKAEFIKQLNLERDLLSESLRRLEDQYEKDVLAFNVERKKLEDDLSSTQKELNTKTTQAEKLTNDVRECQEALIQMELKMKGADEEVRLRILLDEKTAAMVLLEEDLKLKTSALQSRSGEWENAKQREAELEREISRLQSELSDQEEEAEIAIASWETRCEELEELCKFSQDDKDRLNDALEQARTFETRLRETEELFNARLETAISEHDRVQKALADTLRLQTQAEHERLELIANTLQNEKAVLIAERDNLATRVAELDDEVLESRDAMRFSITNGMSDKAFEIATQSLLEQLNQMSEEAALNAASLDTERRDRQAAEEEVRRLRTDLALILGMEDGNENFAEIQKLTLETKGYIQRKEAAEIQSLRSSLERAQTELFGSKASEMESKELSAKANIQASALEQELMTSKNDFQYLVKTMEEMREAELSRRVSFEYRINSLENDKAMLKKIHATEMDNLRNELNQVCIERDRLFVSLKDSEKSKEALMLAPNRAQLSNLNEDTDLNAELEILKIEKARLFAATADETLQFERRLRAAVAAERSSSEADLILEKELRLAAERSVDALKHELEQMQVNLGRPFDPDDGLSASEAIPTSHEMKELKTQIEINTIKAESQRRIEELTRECREVKSEALRVERDNLFEAELQAEMSHVQNNVSFRRNEIDAEESQGIFEEKKDAMQLEHLHRLYEAIKDQKETIEEERSVYFELLAEQDDLLALLAQQDLTESCLKAALRRLGGDEAVEEAAQEARQRAEAKYGKYIEVSAVEST